MRYEPTPALHLALCRAIALARCAGRTAATPADLLHSLLAETEGHCVMTLRQHGLDVAAWQRSHPPTNLVVDEGAAMKDDAFTLPLRHILLRARELPSLLTEEGSLASDQVLLALLAEDAQLRDLLVNFGLNYEALAATAVCPSAPLVVDDSVLEVEPQAPVDLARILDAAANRAAEAFRVLEDYARFVGNDVLLTRKLKQLRHDLAKAMAQLSPTWLLTARDTVHDVGTDVSTSSERQRSSVDDVVRANARRLQEALRSLEEFGKIVDAELGRTLQQLRYESYTIEKALVLGQSARQRLEHARLYVLVTESLCRASLVGTVREAVEGGAEIIQLREKNRSDRELLSLARELRRLTRRLGALFIVNDRPDIAQLSDADGVHLGQDDLPVQEARRIVGPERLIGVSTHNLRQLERAVAEGASYVGIGPTFPSTTKEFAELAGLEYLRAAAGATTLPAFAIGGITLTNVSAVLSAGASRIAVSHAICTADDPRGVARAFKDALNRARRADTSTP
ncbi:MAG: thiamine phosphate synthase [Gemmataceae bacterium]|nr:thiamine phosphate synthase [Gemmataceae bacterium]